MSSEGLNQLQLDLRTKDWPDQSKFPLNQSKLENVEEEIFKDLLNSDCFLVITGFTSLSYIIDLYSKYPTIAEKQIRIVLGFDPIIRSRKKWPKRNFSTDIKNFWLEKGISPTKSGGVIHLIELIRKRQVEFRCSEKIHAKIYVGNSNALLGSSNFSINGLKKQKEANIRVAKDSTETLEKNQYDDIKQIAENFYKDSDDYYGKIIDLLEQLLKLSEWPEALARAISELLHDNWLKKHPEIIPQSNEVVLWPTQEAGVGQALNIIENQGSVLIADPTGSGKTKLVTSILLAITNRRWSTGKGYRTNSLIICPPSVIDNWEKEYDRLRFSLQSPVSNGILSDENSKKHDAAITKIKNGNILIIDEAHNFLSRNSNRSHSIEQSIADCILLVTATPINKRIEDLLRLIELLDIDNLNDRELEQYKYLRRSKSVKKGEDFHELKKYITKFTVRRTKKQLNKEVDIQPEKFISRIGKLCKYPEHVCKTYPTGETDEDREIAIKINNLAEQLSGLLNLRILRFPKYERNPDLERQRTLVSNRLISAKALAKYQILSKLRSSKVALVEHVEGTSEACDHFIFNASKSSTGNMIGKLIKYRESLPNTKEFDQELIPDHLKNLEKYQHNIDEEIEIYKQISSLAKSISDSREDAKIDLIQSLFEYHPLILAFDSTPLTLDYLKYIIDRRKETFRPIVVSGANKNNKELAKECFALGSKDINILGLCSDAMSEGVNLQQASAIVQLDMPSVLRIAEQRIGRIDRMDSPFEQIQAYWPDDSDEFALKTDRKLVNISLMADQLIGSNLDLPEELLGRHLDEIVKAEEMIKIYKENEQKEERILSDGIFDAFQPVRNLYTGEEPIISEDQYKDLVNVSATVRCKVSVVKSNARFGFFALKSTDKLSSKWIFIDSEMQIFDDLETICEKLRASLKEVENGKWNETVVHQMDEYIQLMEQQEEQLLTNKKRRALILLKELLVYWKAREKNDNRRELLTLINNELNPAVLSEEIVDLNLLLETWIEIIQPELADLRARNRKTPKIILDLKPVLKKNPIKTYDLERLANSIEYTDRLGNRIAACIIGLENIENGK